LGLEGGGDEAKPLCYRQGSLGKVDACRKAVVPVSTDDMSLGDPKAKVTVIEYASVACPVCGRWYAEVWPAFKARYIDTGRIHYILREMLVGDSSEMSAAAAGFLLARCAGANGYFKVVDAIFKNQQALFGDVHGTLGTIAKSMGMSEGAFNACITNDQALLALNVRTQHNAEANQVTGTPTFVVNGKAFPAGYQSLSALDGAIAAARAAAAKG
jgi:protein-disulfide isomerase